MELLRHILFKLVASPVYVEVPKCTLKGHKFTQGQTRCLCGLYTWKEYCRRWDRREG